MSAIASHEPPTTDTDATVTLPDTETARALMVLYSLDADPSPSTRFVVYLGGVEDHFHYVTTKGRFTYPYRHWLPGKGELKFTLEGCVGCKGTVSVEFSKKVTP